VLENEAHRPPEGAFNTGIIDWGCNGSTGAKEVDTMLEKAGIPWGSAIAWTTKKLGIKQCSSCNARQKILDNVAEVGWIETLKQIKETF